MALNVACDVISLVISSIAAGVMGQLVLGAIGRVDVEVLSVSPSCAAAGRISAQHATVFSREYVMDVGRTRLGINNALSACLGRLGEIDVAILGKRHLRQEVT